MQLFTNSPHKALPYLQVNLMPAGYAYLNLAKKFVELGSTANDAMRTFQPPSHDVRLPLARQQLKSRYAKRLTVWVHHR